MAMTPKRLRTVLRTVHIGLSILLGFIVYGPPEELGALRWVAQVLVFPATALTGLWMWQQRRVGRWLGRAGRAGASSADG